MATTKPLVIGSAPEFRVKNVKDGETIHQTCLLLDGCCSKPCDDSSEDFIAIKCQDAFGKTASQQNWPIQRCLWKALVTLSPGTNVLTVEHHGSKGLQESLTVTLSYLPLLQLPPLHLAILVAKDSPLVMDCPSVKYGAMSTAHSSLDAAVQKLRVAAYMWQAFTANDLWKKGLGRRSFRLEEEWVQDTTAMLGHRRHTCTTMKSVPKVHIIRTDLTVAELENPHLITPPQFVHQQRVNNSKDKLRDLFLKALTTHGEPFHNSSLPIVAGLILDSHYSAQADRTEVAVSFGSHNNKGVSLGCIGSHFTYSWPRFFEEIPECLLDSRPVGDLVSREGIEDATLGRVCCFSQGELLKNVARAFGAMDRPVDRPNFQTQDHPVLATDQARRGMFEARWASGFLAPKYQSSLEPRWSVADALRLNSMPHFRLPGDPNRSNEFLHDGARYDIELKEGEVNTVVLAIRSEHAPLVQISLSCGEKQEQISLWPPSDGTPTYEYIIDFDDYPRDKPFSIIALTFNGLPSELSDVWRYLAAKPFIIVPNTSIILRKRSARAAYLDHQDENNPRPGGLTQWTCMLHKRRRPNGPLVRATAIDLRVGATFDGAVIEYSDRTRAHCGPAFEVAPRHRNRRNNNRDADAGLDLPRVPHQFGGHVSERREIPQNRTITRVRVRKNESLDGIRMTLDDGTEWGHLNDEEHRRRNGETITLEPEEGHTIVGFTGLSEEGNGFCREFGIITAKDGHVPEIVYDMPDMQNIVPAAAEAARNA